jgi:hypothetical protein
LIGFERFDFRLELLEPAVRKGGAPNRQALEQSEFVEEGSVNDRRDHHVFFVGAELMFEDVGDVNSGERS